MHRCSIPALVALTQARLVWPTSHPPILALVPGTHGRGPGGFKFVPRSRAGAAREVPFVRVDDRVEWVRRDVLKMTLFFNFSLDAEGEAHEAWGELPQARVRVASAPFHGDGEVPLGAVRASSASASSLRRSELL